MNRELVDWLSTQRVPMFDIRKLGGGDLWHGDRTRNFGFMKEGWEVFQRAPQKTARFECSLDELLPLVLEHFPILQSSIGELAVKTAIEDLRLDPWWNSAGPITEEIRWLMRIAFMNFLRQPQKYGCSREKLNEAWLGEFA